MPIRHNKHDNTDIPKKAATPEKLYIAGNHSNKTTMAKLTAEQLQHIFDRLKTVMKPYQKGTMTAPTDETSRYELWNKQPNIMAFGKLRDEVAFAAIVIQKDYVGFHFMPIYARERLREQLDPALMKMLKGKACFHIKSADDPMLKMIASALEAGYTLYKEIGWVA